MGDPVVFAFCHTPALLCVGLCGVREIHLHASLGVSLGKEEPDDAGDEGQDGRGG